MKKVEQKALQATWMALKAGVIDVHFCSEFFACSTKHAYTILRFGIDAGWIESYPYPLCPTTVYGVTTAGEKIIAEQRQKKSPVRALKSASMMPKNPRHDLLVLRAAMSIADHYREHLDSIRTAREIRAGSGGLKPTIGGGLVVPDALIWTGGDETPIAIEVQESAETDETAERRIYQYQDLIDQGSILAVIWASTVPTIRRQIGDIIERGVRSWGREKKTVRQANPATGATAQYIDVWSPDALTRHPVDGQEQWVLDLSSIRADYYADLRLSGAARRR